MTNEEREQLVKYAEMAMSLSPAVEDRVRQIMPLGATESDFYVQMLEDILANRPLTAENLLDSQTLVKERLGLLPS